MAVPVARAVSDDLAAIFPDATPAPAAGRLRIGPGRRQAPRRPLLQGATEKLSAIGIAAFLGVSAGAALSSRAPDAEPARAVASGPASGFAPAALPSPGPLPTSAMLLAAAAPYDPPPAVRAARPRPAKAAAVRKASLKKASRRRPARAAPERCWGAAAARLCGGSDLPAAEARLSGAYASARRAGVAADVLADYRHEWDGLRRRRWREPARVAVQYRKMADNLDGLAVAEKRRAQAGPWRRFRTQMAALWR
jgi:hypothetical protein